MRNDEILCIIKKSAQKEYGLYGEKEIGAYRVQWERAMTVKEAVKKIERLGNVDYLVIEDAKEKDEADVNTAISTDVKVILLGGELLCKGAITVSSKNEVLEQIAKFGETPEEEIESIENNEEEKNVTSREVYASSNESDLNDTYTDENNALELNGIESAKYEEVIRERNNWRNIAENTKYELKLLKEKMEELMVSEEVIEYIGSGVDVKELRIKMEQLERENERLNNTVRQLGGVKSEQRDTEAKLRKAEDSLTAKELTIMDEREATEVLRNTIMQLTFFGRELMEQLHEAKNNMAAAREEKEDSDKNVKKYTKLFNDAEKKIDELEEQLRKLADNMEEVKEANEELSIDIVHLEEDKKSLRAQLDEARGKIEEELKKEESALDVIDEKERELATYRAYKVDEMKDIIEQNRQMSQEYESALNDLNIKNDALRQEVLTLKQKVASYEEMAESARNRMIARERVYNGDNYSAIKVNYIGKAIVVAVVGSGGYGTTSVATAIAENLCSKGRDVAIVDLDMRSPKMDGCYRKNPFHIELLRNKMMDEDRMTSLGVLIKLGGDYWADIHEKLGIEINEKRKQGEGRLVYHSGSYAALSATEMSGANYTAMLKKLGIEFDYIILDLGRMESTGSIANIQTGMCDIANQVFAVTNSSLTDIRSMNVRMITAKIRMSNVCWVTNMLDGKLDQLSMQLISGAESIVNIPLIRDRYGTDFSLAENRKTGAQVELLVAHIK